MKLLFLLLIIVCFSLCSCVREQIFVKAQDCLANGLKVCELPTYNTQKIKVHFSNIPQKLADGYSLFINQKGIESIESELIGLSMSMPINKQKWEKDSSGQLTTRVLPGFCSSQKMKWRLKLHFKLLDENEYYTFIDYEVGER